MGPRLTFAKFGREGKQSYQGEAQPPPNPLSHHPCWKACSPKKPRTHWAGNSPSSGLQAVPPSLHSLPSCPPPSNSLPSNSHVSPEKDTGGCSAAQTSCRPLRPHSPTGTAAVSAGWGSSSSPSPSRLWGRAGARVCLRFHLVPGGGGSSLPTLLSTPRVKFRVA